MQDANMKKAPSQRGPNNKKQPTGKRQAAEIILRTR